MGRVSYVYLVSWLNQTREKSFTTAVNKPKLLNNQMSCLANFIRAREVEFTPRSDVVTET